MSTNYVFEIPAIKVKKIERSGSDPIVLDPIQIPKGAGEGKVLVSNENGVASWGDSITNGTSGTSGNSGTSGTSGNSATNGTSGTSGSSGSSGTSGTSGFPYTYRSKWNSGFNVTPIMNSESKPSPYIVTGQSDNINYAWKAFDNYYVTNWSVKSYTNDTYCRIYLGSIGIALGGYSIRANQYGGNVPSKWCFQGSNDGTHWITLDTRSKVSSFEKFEIRTYTFSNSNVYKYYQWTSFGTGTELSVCEFKIISSPETYSKFNIVYHNSSTYICIQDNIASSDTEPGVGINWSSYWELLSKGGASFAPVGMSTQLIIAKDNEDVTNNHKSYFLVPKNLNGFNLTRAQAVVNKEGRFGITEIQIRNITKYPNNDVLTKIIIDSGQTVGTPGIINTLYNNVSTDDLIKVSVTTITSNAPNGLIVVLEFS